MMPRKKSLKTKISHFCPLIDHIRVHTIVDQEGCNNGEEGVDADI
jgi:hypothetical protein